MTAHLAAEGVGYRIGGAALVTDVSLEVAGGEVVGLVGPNGAGKSTLLALLAGDLTPVAGCVRIAGRDLRRVPARRLARMRAVLLQQTLVRFPFTARDVVAMGRSPHIGVMGRLGTRDHEVVDEQMARVEVGGLAGRSVTTLSGGEGARVALARVLAQEAPVVLLDEPTAALDLRHQEIVMRTARELAAAGAAVVAVLHDLNLAAAHCDRVAVMSRGRLVSVAPPWDALTPARLAEVFALPVLVMRRPHGGGPLVVPDPAGPVTARAPVSPLRPPASDGTGPRTSDR